MKKFSRFKTIQLIVSILYIILCFCYLAFFKDMIPLAHNEVIVILLWFLLLLHVTGLLLDYFLFGKFINNYESLNYAVSTDLVSGIPNRFNCDSIIDKFHGRPLPEHFVVIMFELSNIKEMNKDFGRTLGDRLIRDFAGVLCKAASDMCFVGRNGGNKFLVLFENAADNVINDFLQQIEVAIQMRNKDCFEYPIQYQYGIAVNKDSGTDTITDLISLADSRLVKKTGTIEDKKET